jgi:hypothetical protein
LLVNRVSIDEHHGSWDKGSIRCMNYSKKHKRYFRRQMDLLRKLNLGAQVDSTEHKGFRRLCDCALCWLKVAGIRVVMAFVRTMLAYLSCQPDSQYSFQDG